MTTIGIGAFISTVEEFANMTELISITPTKQYDQKNYHQVSVFNDDHHGEPAEEGRLPNTTFSRVSTLCLEMSGPRSLVDAVKTSKRVV